MNLEFNDFTCAFVMCKPVPKSNTILYAFQEYKVIILRHINHENEMLLTINNENNRVSNKPRKRKLRPLCYKSRQKDEILPDYLYIY